MNTKLQKQNPNESFEQVLSSLLQINKPLSTTVLKLFDRAMLWDKLPDSDLLDKSLGKFCSSENSYILCLLMDKYRQKKTLSLWQEKIQNSIRQALSSELNYPKYLSGDNSSATDDALLREKTVKDWLREESVKIISLEAELKKNANKSNQQKKDREAVTILPVAKIIRTGKLNATEQVKDVSLPSSAISIPVESGSSDITSEPVAKEFNTVKPSEGQDPGTFPAAEEKEAPKKADEKSIFKEWYYKVTCCVMAEQIETVRVAMMKTLNNIAFQHMKKPKISDKEFTRQLFFESSIEGVLAGNLQMNILASALTFTAGNSSETDLAKQEKLIERIAGLNSIITELKSEIARMNVEKESLVARSQEFMSAANREKNNLHEITQQLKDENCAIKNELLSSADLLKKEKERYELLKTYSDRELQKQLAAEKYKLLTHLSHDVDSAIGFLEHEGSESVDLGLRRLRRIKEYIAENIGRI